MTLLTPSPVPRTPPAPPLEPALLRDIAEGLAAAEDLWRPHVHHDTGRRRPVRLLASERWEAWAIGWTVGQRVELHDHGASAGSVVVVEGELVDVRLVDGHLVHHRLPAGTATALPVGVVHDIVATGPGAATSLHVYAPVLERMTFYRRDGRPLRTEAVAEEPPAAALPVAGRALHPSARRG